MVLRYNAIVAPSAVLMQTAACMWGATQALAWGASLHSTKFLPGVRGVHLHCSHTGQGPRTVQGGTLCTKAKVAELCWAQHGPTQPGKARPGLAQ